MSIAIKGHSFLDSKCVNLFHLEIPEDRLSQVWWSVSTLVLMSTRRTSFCPFCVVEITDHHKTCLRPHLGWSDYHCMFPAKQKSLCHEAVIYSQTAMSQTSLGPWKFVPDMSSSSHRGWITAPGQEANEDNLVMSFRSSLKKTKTLYWRANDTKFFF